MCIILWVKKKKKKKGKKKKKKKLKNDAKSYALRTIKKLQSVLTFTKDKRNTKIKAPYKVPWDIGMGPG